MLKDALPSCSAGKDHNAGLAESTPMGLDDCLEYIVDDELVEVSRFNVKLLVTRVLCPVQLWPASCSPESLFERLLKA